jgi:hypothetical protein
VCLFAENDLQVFSEDRQSNLCKHCHLLMLLPPAAMVVLDL